MLLETVSGYLQKRDNANATAVNLVFSFLFIQVPVRKPQWLFGQGLIPHTGGKKITLF